MVASTARTGIACFVMGLFVGFLAAPWRGAELRLSLGRVLAVVGDRVLVGLSVRPARLREENVEDLVV